MRTLPGPTRCPSCTERRATNPATGAGMRVGAVHHGALGFQLFPGGLERGARCIARIHRVLQLLARHCSARLDALAPSEIALGLAKIGAPQRHVRLGLGARRAQGPHRAHGLRELGFRLRERNLRVGLVELDERVAAVHVFGIVRAYREHCAGDL